MRLARGLLEDSTPNFRRQAAWLLALQTMASGDPEAAHGWLCTLGEDERTAILSRDNDQIEALGMNERVTKSLFRGKTWD